MKIEPVVGRFAAQRLEPCRIGPQRLLQRRFAAAGAEVCQRFEAHVVAVPTGDVDECHEPPFSRADERMLAGEPNVLIPDAPVFFAM